MGDYWETWKVFYTDNLMSEYHYVEKPFLDQLDALGWDVIDQGEGIPVDPAISHRSDFREVVLKDIFKDSVRQLNLTEDGKEWLNDKQLDDLFEELTRHPDKSLLEANMDVLQRLYKITVDMNEVTGEEYPVVKLIDFQNWRNNRYLAINQFRIDTPGRVKDHIRPDIVLFVNGLPLVVVECKDANAFTSDPMAEGIKQLRRYSDQREETIAAGLKEGEERLFHFNQLMISTTGEEARFGSITSTDDYFYEWKSIFPEEYQEFKPPLGIGKVRSQETLIQGMLAPQILLDIVRNFIIFMNIGEHMVKVICRYQQYRAVSKIIGRLREKPTPTERSGTIWHTQGSGKSLTMVFLVRKLRRCDDLKDYKVIMVIDRVDLEDQLGKTAALTDEKVRYLDSTAAVKERLSGDQSNLNIVMVHKFKEAESRLPDYVSDAIGQHKNDDRVGQPPPEYNVFGTVNESERILMLVDEAHRTQSSELGNNLFEAFPNATRIAFTGTPLITERHSKKTWQRFGNYIDQYKLQDAVEDGTTVQILYEGRTADTAIADKHQFETKFEDLFGDLTDEQLLAIKKKYGATGDILDAEKRIEAIAQDLVKHYIENILPNGFKAQVVCHSKMAAVHYKTYIDKALTDWLDQEKTSDTPDKEMIRAVEFLQSAVVVSSEGTNEKAVITQARKHAREVDAIENFKKQFDYSRPETSIAILIVCDMLLTGFDAPVEQVMYIDKKIREHNLLQAIARVNRVATGKTRGYVVDYIGLARHLREALSIYSSDDQDEILASLQDVTTEMPILESRYQRLINLFKNKGEFNIQDFVEQRINDTQKQFDVLEQAIELMEDIKSRESFRVYYKKFMQSMDIVLPHSLAQPFKIPMKRFGYILAKVRERYKDDSLNITHAGEKVKKLVNEHLISLGINPKIPPVELYSPHFMEQVKKNKSTRARASEMEHAIRKHCKINWEKDPALYKKMVDKLDGLIKKHQEDWDKLAEQLELLGDEVISGREGDPDDTIEAPFRDLIADMAFKEDSITEQHLAVLDELTHRLLAKLRETIGIIDFWENGFEVKRLKGELSDILLSSNIDEIIAESEHIVTEITALARVRHHDIIG